MQKIWAQTLQPALLTLMCVISLTVPFSMFKALSPKYPDPPILVYLCSATVFAVCGLVGWWAFQRYMICTITTRGCWLPYGAIVFAGGVLVWAGQYAILHAVGAFPFITHVMSVWTLLCCAMLVLVMVSPGTTVKERQE